MQQNLLHAIIRVPVYSAHPVQESTVHAFPMVKPCFQITVWLYIAVALPNNYLNPDS